MNEYIYIYIYINEYTYIYRHIYICIHIDFLYFSLDCYMCWRTHGENPANTQKVQSGSFTLRHHHAYLR